MLWIRTSLVVLFVIAGASGLRAQDTAHDTVNDTVAPVVMPPVIAPPIVAPLTPQQLVGKSVEDLQTGGVGPAVQDDIKALRRGPLLIHGNYCGIGNRPGTAPVDALDEACMHHDACTRTGTLPPCACDERLRLAATVIAADPGNTPDVRTIAGATAAAMAVLICK